MQSFTTLKKSSKIDSGSFTKIKLALLGDTPTQFLAKAIHWAGVQTGYDLNVYDADYNQIDRQLLDASSAFYLFEPQYTVLFFSAKKMGQQFLLHDVATQKTTAEAFLQHISLLVTQVNSKIQTTIILFNLDEQQDGVFGNYANKTTSSFAYQLRKINMGLMDLSQQVKNLFINDVVALQSRYGTEQIFSPLLYADSGFPFNLDFTAELAVNTIRIVGAVQGQFKKCLILDLDNTIWGGIIGDDGLEKIQLGDLGLGKVFTAIQSWAKALKERGIILCICSKNEEMNAKEPFTKHADMVLGLDDIAVFVANWKNKADNIRYIQSVLNIGFDSMVFIDDNAFERNMVRQELPLVTVPELPEDPVDYLHFLVGLNLFETASLSAEDGERTRQYQAEAGRMQLQQAFTDEAGYLGSLDMKATLEPFTGQNIPRVTQLIQRSNQFNLRTQRYNEQQVESIANDPGFECIAGSLTDKYGSYGLIIAVILQQQDAGVFFIDTWVMSCRVLNRGMEDFTTDQIVRILKQKGARKLTGEYLPTAKNGLVANLYSSLGFTFSNGLWELDLDLFQSKENFIQTV